MIMNSRLEHYPNKVKCWVFFLGLLLFCPAFFFFSIYVQGLGYEQWFINKDFWTSDAVIALLILTPGFFFMFLSAIYLSVYRKYMKKVADLAHTGIVIDALIIGVVAYRHTNRIAHLYNPKYHIKAFHNGRYFYSPFLSKRDQKIYANMKIVNILVSKEDLSIYRMLYKSTM